MGGRIDISKREREWPGNEHLAVLLPNDLWKVCLFLLLCPRDLLTCLAGRSGLLLR